MVFVDEGPNWSLTTIGSLANSCNSEDKKLPVENVGSCREQTAYSLSGSATSVLAEEEYSCTSFLM
jgi:hypothetical protein